MELNLINHRSILLPSDKTFIRPYIRLRQAIPLLILPMTSCSKIYTIFTCKKSVPVAVLLLIAAIQIQIRKEIAVAGGR